jgi:hypothetical protein
MSAWPPPIEDLRVRAGLLPNDATKDAALLAAGEVSLDLIEQYLDRRLLYSEYHEWDDKTFGTALLRAWPLDRGSGIYLYDTNWIKAGSPTKPSPSYVLAPTLSSIGPNNAMVVPWDIWQASGNVVADGSAGTFSSARVDWDRGIVYNVYGRPLVLTYFAGYRTLPPTLLWAMNAVFDAVWASDSAFGGTAGSGLIQGSGAVKKVSLVGIGSVDFDVGTTAVSSGSGAGGGADPWSLIPATVVAVLDRFRRESVVGCG